jgi:FMN reductase
MNTQRKPLIVGIGGASRENSITERALSFALDIARSLGATTQLFTHDQLDVPMYAPENADRTPEASALVKAFREFDGLILASPSYHGTFSGMVKNVLDYTEDLRADAEPYLHGRPVALIATAHGWQDVGYTLVSLRSVVHALRGWPTPLGVGISTLAEPFDDQGRCLDDKLAGQLRALAEQVVKFAGNRDLLVERIEAESRAA